MKIFYRFIVFLVGCLISNMELYAQGNDQGNHPYQPIYDNIKPVTPSQFDFIKYTELPVSLYTGKPNISIPLYQINVDGLKIPIALSYYAGGIRVNQEASWVGLGWDLSFGSVIQTVNDGDDYGIDQLGKPLKKMRPDYMWSPTPSELPRRWDYAKKFSDLGQWFPGSGWQNPLPKAPIQAELSYKIATDYYIPVNGEFDTQQLNFFDAHTSFDAEPDIFRANFFGHSINFMIDWDNPYSNCLTCFKVLNKKGYSVTKTTNGFEIIVPTGEQYFFEELSVVKSLATATNCGGVGGGDQANSRNWMITKIVTRNKREILFNYQRTSRSSNFPNFSQNWKYGTTPDFTKVNYEWQGFPDGICGTSFGAGVTNFSLSTSTEERLHLSKITFPSGEIDLSLSPSGDLINGYKLDKFSVQSGSTVKEFNFNYSFFATAGSQNGYSVGSDFQPYISKRLQLNSIQQTGGERYEFTYNATPLPPKNSFAQDLWGYYNGSTSNTSLVPNPSRFKKPEFGDNGNNNAANLQYTKAGTLESIKYPTGGTTSFEYELNQYGNIWVPDYTTSSNTISTGQGLRIKTITFNADLATPTKKVIYSYNGGKAILPVEVFKSYPYNKYQIGNKDGYPYFSSTVTEATSTGFYSPSMFSSVNGVGYDEVTEQTVDMAGNNIGKTVSMFQNVPDKINMSAQWYCQLSAVLPAVKHIENPENGSLKTAVYYDNLNNPVKKVENDYVVRPSDISYGARIFGYKNLCFFNPVNGNFQVIRQDVIGYYPIFDIETLNTKTTETLYNGSSNGIVTQIEKSYNGNYNNLINTRTTNSKNVVIDESYTYPYDYTGLQVYNEMVNRNILEPATEQTTTMQVNGSTKQLSKTKTNYALWNNNVTIAPASKEASINGNMLETQATFEKYDNYGNPVQFTDKDGVTTSIVWGYNGTYLVAKIAGNSYDVATAGVDLAKLDNAQNYTDDEIRAELSKLRGIHGNALVITYTYSPLAGVTSETDVNGKVTYYDYDDLGRLSTVRDNDKNIVRRICYNFNGQPEDCLRLFKSSEKSQQFNRNNCGDNYQPGSIVYTVSAGKYTSAFSQADADAQALNDISTNGQNFANANAVCMQIFKSTAQSQSFNRACGANMTGTSVTYTVPAGKYTSIISQNDADQKALNEISGNGQMYANANGSCPSPVPTIDLVTASSPRFIRMYLTPISGATAMNYHLQDLTNNQTISNTGAPSGYVTITAPNGNRNYRIWVTFYSPNGSATTDTKDIYVPN